jgi:hypothetical protein
MTDDTSLALTRELHNYAAALRSVEPSQALDLRMNDAIEAWAARNRSRPTWKRPLAWIAVAASVAVISTGVALLSSRERTHSEGLSAAAAAELPGVQFQRTGVPALAVGQVSQWPAEAAIFRVRASFASAPGFVPPGAPQQGERQYWVDVRIANDGTMRIMQVLPAHQ